MKQWNWIVLLLLYAAAIGYGSHRPLSLGESPFAHADKLAHLAEFALFMLLAWQATGKHLLSAWLLTLIFAGSDEWHQALIPARDASVLEFVAGFVGAGIMAALIYKRTLLWQFFSTRILGR